MTEGVAASGERAELIESLAGKRFFLRNTTRDLSDEQASQRTTVSELTLAGLIKHVSQVEDRWVRFILEGPSAMADPEDAATRVAWADGFRITEGETLAGLLAYYESVARHTDEVIATLPDLDASQELPARRWFKPGTRWSARRVVLHLIGETAQHAGHADIIREALDGAKSMG
jgi:hypothetical protein